MSDPNLTPPPYGDPPEQGPADAPAPSWGAPPPAATPPPGQYPQQPNQYPPQPGQPPAPPGQFAPPPGQFTPPGQFPMQPAAQPFVPGQRVVEGWVPELGVQIGSAGNRIGAKAIDIVLYLIIQTLAGVIASVVFLATTNSSESFSTGAGFGFSGGSILFSIVAGLVLLLIDFLYNVVCTAQFGGTPGKLMLGLRVIRSDNGAQVDLSAAFLRWSPILVLAVLALLPIVSLFAAIGRFGLLITNLVMVLTDERRRDVFDRVASTYVITTR